MGDALPALDLGTGRSARSVVASGYSTCALLDDGHVKCWGYNLQGQLGQGDTLNRGGLAGQMGDALSAIDLGQGRTATGLAAGATHICARLDDGRLKCWGWNLLGQLGVGDSINRGSLAGQMGDALPAVDLGVGRSAKSMGGGYAHTCAVLDDASVKCWGQSSILGLGDNRARGMNPGEMGDALPAVDLTPPFDLTVNVDNCGALAHSCLGGACVLGVCQPITLIGNQLRPAKLRLSGGMLTWTTHGDGSGNGGGVYRSSVNGGAITTIASGLSTTSSLAVDEISTAWTDSAGIHIVANVGGPSVTLAPTAGDSAEIAMDATDLYFTNFPSHQVVRVSRDGASGLLAVADLEDSPFGITLDNANVYFTNLFSGSVKSLPKSGGAVTELATGGGASQIVLDNSYAYWVGDGGLKRVYAIGGGPTEVLANDPTIQLSAIGIDSDSVFFPTYDNGFGTIQAVSLNGGVPRVLASGQSLVVEGLQSDGAALYYTDAYGGRVMKVAK